MGYAEAKKSGDVLIYLLYGETSKAKEGIYDLTDDELRLSYKASKQLSELCWQEIRRRRDG